MYFWLYSRSWVEILCLLGIGIFLWAFGCSRVYNTVRQTGNAVLTAVWTGIVLYVTLLSRTPAGETYTPSLLPFAQLAAVLGGANPETLRTTFMNWLLFLPGGLFSAQFLPEQRLLLYIGVSGALFSILIETAQLLSARGMMETDDILVNTLGMLAGGWVGLQVRRLVADKSNNDKSGDLPGSGGNYGNV